MRMDDKNLYTENSIESLDPREFTRLKPGVYCGSTEYSTQLLIEILSNAIDEYRLGHGNIIDINITDSFISLTDNGQGFLPNCIREDGKTVLEAAFSVLNTSGKFTSEGTYEGTSLGTYGIGCKLTNFLSHYLRVCSQRDGLCETILFKEGIFQERWIEETNPRWHGTYVEWQPSEEFFTHTNIEKDKIEELIKTLVCLCPKLIINVNSYGRYKIYQSQNGLQDLVDEAVKNKEIITNRFCLNEVNNKNKIDMVLTYTSNYSSTLIPYVNTGLTESGPHITQLKTAITKEFNKFFREKKWLKEKEENLTGEDIQEGIYIVFNLTAPDVGYDAQLKNRVVKIDTKPFIQMFVQAFQQWLNGNEKEIKTIADKAINARRAREAAKKARDVIRDNQKKKEKKVLKFDSKLADCYSKDRSKCELIVTEGDSASGNLKAARNNEFQAVIPVRGKILNTLRATADKIQKNTEIMTIAEAIGLTFDTKSIQFIYHPKDLRYGKIIIMTDAERSAV